MEFVTNSKGIIAVVDYAHDPISIERVYKSLKNITLKNNSRLVCILGSCGGGRDKNTRYQKGEVAGKLCDYVFVTNEDPYDEDPMEIIKQVSAGAKKVGKKLNNDLFEILDRGEAIQKAVDLTKKGDLILVTGKGSEQAIVVANGEKILWDDRDAIRKSLNKKKI